VEAPPVASGKPQTSGLAGVAFALSLLGFCTCGLAWAPGFVLGIAATVQAFRNPMRFDKTLAIGSLVIMVAGILVCYPIVMNAHKTPPVITCINNVKQLAVSMAQYEADYDDHLPPKENWSEELHPYLRNDQALHCPSGDIGVDYYALNAHLDRRKYGDMWAPAATVQFFDARVGLNAFGGQNIVVYRHGEKTMATIGFADGHVKALTESDITSRSNITFYPQDIRFKPAPPQPTAAHAKP